MRIQDFKCKISKSFFIITAILLCSSLFIVLTQPLGWAARFALIAILAVYGGYIVWRHVLLQGRMAVNRLIYQGHGRWQISTPHQSYTAELRGDSTVTAWVSILRFNIPERRFPVSVTVFRDSFVKDEYRRLIVLLKWENTTLLS